MRCLPPHTHAHTHCERNNGNIHTTRSLAAYDFASPLAGVSSYSDPLLPSMAGTVPTTTTATATAAAVVLFSDAAASASTTPSSLPWDGGDWSSDSSDSDDGADGGEVHTGAHPKVTDGVGAGRISTVVRTTEANKERGGGRRRRNIRILCLDGGGLRGAVQLSMMSYMRDTFGLPCLSLSCLRCALCWT